jgi:hypothetical protein
MWKVDNGALAGVTASAYATALDWGCRELGAKTILLKNSDAAQSLKYRLLAYASDGGISRELVTETVLLAGEVAEFHLDRQWHRLEIDVRDGSGHAAWALDYEGQGA